MENLGALAILLAFCFALYAILGSLVGKWKQKPFPGGKRRARRIHRLGSHHRRFRPAAVFPDRRRLPHGLCLGSQQQDHADLLQDRRVVGRPGRLAAAVGVPPGHVCGRGGVHLPAEVPGHDALRHQRADGDAGVLPVDDLAAAEPLPGVHGRQGRPGPGRRPGPESAAPVLDHGDPSAHAVPGLRRVLGSVRFRDRFPDHPPAGRRLDPHHAALGR